MTKPTWRLPSSYAAGLALTAVVAACGGPGDSPVVTTTASSGSGSPSPSSSPTSSTSATGAGRTIAITVSGNQVTPPPSTVRLAVGETVTLTVTSDHDDELHVHGFDVEKELRAGTPTRVTVTGEQPGVYEVETHHPELRLLKIAVR